MCVGMPSIWAAPGGNASPAPPVVTHIDAQSCDPICTGREAGQNNSTSAAGLRTRGAGRAAGLSRSAAACTNFSVNWPVVGEK